MYMILKKLFQLPTWLVFVLLISQAFLPSTGIWLIVRHVFIFSIIFLVYNIGVALHGRLPSHHGLNINVYTACLALITVFYVYILIYYPDGFYIDNNNYESYGSMVYVLAPLTLAVLFSFIYVIRFIAKAMATIKFGSRVTFAYYINNFLLIWFWPIGIWWIYPELKTVINGD